MQENNAVNIQIYGDSILRGVLLDSDKMQYYSSDAHLRKYEETFNVNLLNKSTFGCIIGKGYRRIKAMLSKANRPCEIAVLEFGGNDCDFNWQEISENPEGDHIPHTPLSHFKETYLKIISDLKNSGIIPVIMSLPPVCAEKYLDWITRAGLSRDKILSWLKDAQTIARYQEMYSLAVTQIALLTQCHFIDIRSAFLDRRDCTDLVCEDGIHPNSEGQKLIADVCMGYTRRNSTLIKAAVPGV